MASIASTSFAFRRSVYNCVKRRFSNSHQLLSKLPKNVAPTANLRPEELLKFFQQKIRLNGPIPVADFMRTAISSPNVGYYSRFSPDDCTIFGEKGDFITAPELCQMYGEMIGVWCYYELANCGHKGQWQLVESGPGSGQLMKDIVGVMERFKETDLSIHLIEMSDALILEQEKTLCGKSSEFISDNPHVRYNTTKGGIPVYWYRSLDEIPAKFSVFIASEFLDALPIHQFKRGEDGKWHEVYVNVDENGKLVFMVSKSENLFTVGLLPDGVRKDPDRKEFEICPDAGTYVNQIAEHITAFGGFALIVDYGHDGTRNDLSLRAYSKHKLVHPLEKPGEYDLTADVDFGYLKHLVEDRVLVFGPEEQREFLTQMGIGHRLRRLLEKCDAKSDQEELIKAHNFLLSEDGMGTRFKVMSLFPKTLSRIIDVRGGFPAGFGTKENKIRNVKVQEEISKDRPT